MGRASDGEQSSRLHNSYPLVHPTSIPLQFLSNLCSPFKEIGFKPWHELAPPDWIDTDTPRGHSARKRPTLTLLHLVPFSPAVALSFPHLSSPALPALLLSPTFALSTLHLFFFPLRVPPCQSTVWATLHILLQCDGQAPPGSDGVICLEKWTGIKKKKKKRQMTMSPNDCREREWQTERCVSR